MLPALALVLVTIAIGDLLTAMLAAPVPGSILGLVGAAAYFASRGGPTPAMSGMFDALIPYAPMLFVPAGAGFVANVDLIATSWLPIVAVITLGTTGALLATGFVAQLLLNRIAPVEAARWLRRSRSWPAIPFSVWR